MRNPYWHCIKEVILQTFEHKQISISFTISLILMGVGIISNISVPLLLKRIIESFDTPGDIPLALILISYGCIWMISQIANDLRTFLIYKVEQRITYTLGVKVLSHLYGLSQRYFIDQKPGAITNLIRRAQQDVPTLILGFFFHVLPTLLEFLFVIVIIAILYPPQFSLLLGGTLVLFFCYTSFSMKSVLYERHLANEVDQNTDGIITDWISNYEAIKTFGQQNLAINTCKRELKNRENAEVTFMTKLSVSRLGQSLILGVGLSLLTYLVGSSVMVGDLTIGDFVLFNGYILQFIIPINILGQIIQDIKKSFVNMQGFIDVLITKSDVTQGNRSLNSLKQTYQIEFQNVNFGYHERNILENISFKIESGETALIIGPSGIGKSTIAKLLLRLYDVKQGQILINKINIKDLTFQSLYDFISWVPQETYLLNDTIKNNILFVKPEASFKELEIALQQAALFDFVMSLPSGIDTFVGDKGLKLSGGQKQRISLARLFLKKPKICIFDEPTSSLDKVTERTIQNNIERYLPQMTKIIITHHPFIVKKADKIIQIDWNGSNEVISLESTKNNKNAININSKNLSKNICIL